MTEGASSILHPIHHGYIATDVHAGASKISLSVKSSFNSWLHKINVGVATFWTFVFYRILQCFFFHSSTNVMHPFHSLTTLDINRKLNTN